MTDDERVSRGHRARQEYSLTAEAFEGVKAHLLEQLSTTPGDQPAKVLQLHTAIQNLALVRKALFLVIEDGNVAAAIAESGLTRN